MKSLSDVIGNAGLALYAEIALVLFLIVFVAISLRLLLSDRRGWERAAQLPLQDDSEPGSRHD